MNGHGLAPDLQFTGVIIGKLQLIDRNLGSKKLIREPKHSSVEGMTDVQDNTRHVESEADQDNMSINWVVTITAVVLVAAVVLWGLIGKDSFAEVSGNVLNYLVEDFGWLFMLAGTAFVGFVLFVAMSKFGHIRLGKENERPEFSTVSWISMLFAAGMGIGLMFYGTTEPLTFFRNGVPGHEAEQAGPAFASTIFHWGLHPWAIYSVVALAIAYSSYRLGNKQLLSAAFIPLIGKKRAEGPIGSVIDILAIFTTVFGTAASLGLGALQIRSGLEVNDLVTNPSQMVIVAIVAVLGLCFLVSAASGVGKGIQYLSNFNMVLALILALFVFIVGPTVIILNYFPNALGSYLSEFFDMASRSANAGEETESWLNAWTIFYWAWWTSWSPFVGMFIARISRGRTIREFVIVVLLVPTIVSVVWFSIFGGTAITFEKEGRSIWGDGDATSQLFTLLHEFPGGVVVSLIAMLLLATFFITSADSASTVMGSMSQNGKETASRSVTVVWGLLTALIAVVMLTTGGEDALTNLQNLTIIAASPFVLIIIGLTFSIARGLANDPAHLAEKEYRKYTLRQSQMRRIGQKKKETWHRQEFGESPAAAVGTTEEEGSVLPIHDVETDEGVVNVIKVEDIQDIVEQAQAAVHDARQAADTAVAAADDAGSYSDEELFEAYESTTPSVVKDKS